MGRSYKDSFRRLYEIAADQQGFFTAKQAKSAGFAENTHPYHVHAGNWIREHRGIYRLALFPPTEHPDLVLWALWSRNRDDQIEGVYSHQTALSIYDLSDLNPAKLHMTVPNHFRRNSEIPGILVLHYAELPANDIQTAQGFKFTRPLRAIIDLIDGGEVSHEFILQALREGVSRGLITYHELRKTAAARRTAGVFEELVGKVA